MWCRCAAESTEFAAQQAVAEAEAEAERRLLLTQQLEEARAAAGAETGAGHGGAKAQGRNGDELLWRPWMRGQGPKYGASPCERSFAVQQATSNNTRAVRRAPTIDDPPAEDG